MSSDIVPTDSSQEFIQKVQEGADDDTYHLRDTDGNVFQILSASTTTIEYTDGEYTYTKPMQEAVLEFALTEQKP